MTTANAEIPVAVPYRSSTHGVLYYYSQPENGFEPPRGVFRPRRAGPGRIRIQPLISAGLGPPLKPEVNKTSSKRQLSVKLATTRENAKRFLRSVIQSSSTPKDSTPSNDPEQAARERQEALRAKRRSWSPTTWATTLNWRDGENLPECENQRANMRGHAIRGSISGPVNAYRPRLHSDARNSPSQSGATTTGNVSNAASPRIEPAVVDSFIPSLDSHDEKPVASGNGVSISIHLAEPVLFLQGFDNADNTPGNTAMLRGSLHMRVTKSAKIKAVSLRFKGKATTKWPEGIPPRKVDFDETDTIMNHTWTFWSTQFPDAEHNTGASHVQLFKSTETQSGASRLDPLGRSSPNSSNVNLTAKEAKRLSLAVNQSRSFNKNEAPTGANSVAAKGYRTFLPGDYIYNFELPLDSRLPETIDVELGSVRYELEAEITRSGAFRANLLGNKEVQLIRAPAEGSLEQVEPIAISRNWEDQLHYDIVISGKSFPLGSQVPIAFKLTPLAKVQCHRIKVLITENIEYFCSNKKVHRMEPARKVQLFEKRSDQPPVSTFPGSTMRVTAGGGIPYDQRARAAAGEEVTPVDTSNLLGNLEGDTNIGPTEMEFNVQLPSCHNMKDRDRGQRLHFDTTYQNIQVHHWIKIVMRLSRPDAVDPNKRRHFEISIDSPFHILSCRATQANISLPAYSSPQSAGNGTSLYECGCPGAARRRNSPSSFVPTLNSLNTSRNGSTAGLDRDQPILTHAAAGLARPQAAHIHGAQPGADRERPIHLLRAPSFNPPAFEDELPPPPLVTPPPQYNDIASPTSGLADYFSRLGDAYDDDEEGEDGHRPALTPGRVNVPLTPGGRIHRSMDLGRSWVPVGQ